jgi:hypothetical protein
MPASASEIKSVVLKEDDFGHEMRVGQTVRSFPLIQVQHGGTYTDSVTQKPRQFDYRCWLRQGDAQLKLSVECKNLSLSNPLVVCGTKRRKNEAFHELIESRQGTFQRRGATFTGLSSITRHALMEDCFYLPDEFVGKSLIRIQTDKNPMVKTSDADIYDKWSQALSSSVELAQSACGAAMEFKVNHFYTAILPIVVVPDRSLWSVAYDITGGISADPVEADSCELFVGRDIEVNGPIRTPNYQRFMFSHVHFFTLNGFASFLSKMVTDEHAWGKIFTDSTVEV